MPVFRVGQRGYCRCASQAKRPVMAILGRPYNSFTTDANMDIPRKYTSRGYSVIPFDILPFETQAIYPNMYWYYQVGQCFKLFYPIRQNTKSIDAGIKNLYGCAFTNVRRQTGKTFIGKNHGRLKGYKSRDKKLFNQPPVSTTDPVDPPQKAPIPYIFACTSRSRNVFGSSTTT